MRHPVSTLTASRGSERLRGVMAGDVVHGTVLPAAPEDTDPRSGEDADGVLMATPTRAGALVDEGRPARSVAGIISEGREGSAQTGEQVGRRAAATVGVLPEELDQALFAEAGRAVRRGVAGKEREGDRRVDVGKDFRRAGPEALEERAKLVGERDALGDEIVPAAHEGAQRARVIGGRVQGSEAMAVRAEQIGEDERIAGVTLAAGGGVARATGLE